MIGKSPFPNPPNNGYREYTYDPRHRFAYGDPVEVLKERTGEWLPARIIGFRTQERASDDGPGIYIRCSVVTELKSGPVWIVAHQPSKIRLLA